MAGCLFQQHTARTGNEKNFLQHAAGFARQLNVGHGSGGKLFFRWLARIKQVDNLHHERIIARVQ